MKLGDSQIIARLMEPGDRNFVLSTWLRSFKDMTRGKRRDEFFRFTRPQVEADVTNGTVLIACDEAEPGSIVGWVCYRDDIVRWAYTVYPLRNNGVYRFLRQEWKRANEDASSA